MLYIKLFPFPFTSEYCLTLSGPRHMKACLLGFQTTKAQTSLQSPAYLCSLISTFVILSLESIISELATSQISICQQSLLLSRLVLVEPGRKPQRQFSHVKAHLLYDQNNIFRININSTFCSYYTCFLYSKQFTLCGPKTPKLVL